MKQVLNFAPSFNKTAKTLDFTGYTGFDIRNLLAVINNKAGVIIYAQGVSGKGYSAFAAGVVTLSYDTSAMANTDSLTVIYDTTDVGTAADSAATSDTGSFSLIALIKRLLGKLPTIGGADVTASLPVAMPVDTLVSTSGKSAVNTDLLTGTVSGWYDAQLFHSGAVQVIGSAGISAGAITVEQTNDTTNAAAGVTLPIQEPATVGNSSLIGAQAIAASTARVFTFPILARYIRVRISTAFTGGTVGAVAVLSQLPYAATAMQALNPTAANLNVTASISTISAALAAGTNLIGYANAKNDSATDVASAALTTTTTTTAFTPNAATGSYQVIIPVTAVTGTNPVMDVAIQETDDGTNWFDVYHFERITATGAYRSPLLPYRGKQVRYVQTVAGTTPSFTRSIVRETKPTVLVGPTYRFFDRSITATTTNSAGSVLNVEGAVSLGLVLCLGAATAAPTFGVLLSEDGTNFYDAGISLVGVANSAVTASVQGIFAKFAKIYCKTGGTTVTYTYSCLRAVG